MVFLTGIFKIFFMKTLDDYFKIIIESDFIDDIDFINAKTLDEFLIEKLKHLIIADFKNEGKKRPTQEGE